MDENSKSEAQVSDEVKNQPLHSLIVVLGVDVQHCVHRPLLYGGDLHVAPSQTSAKTRKCHNPARSNPLFNQKGVNVH